MFRDDSREEEEEGVFPISSTHSTSHNTVPLKNLFLAV
jgi:hypothetical protein